MKMQITLTKTTLAALAATAAASHHDMPAIASKILESFFATYSLDDLHHAAIRDALNKDRAIQPKARKEATS